MSKCNNVFIGLNMNSHGCFRLQSICILLFLTWWTILGFVDAQLDFGDSRPSVKVHVDEKSSPKSFKGRPIVAGVLKDLHSPIKLDVEDDGHVHERRGRNKLNSQLLHLAGGRFGDHHDDHHDNDHDHHHDPQDPHHQKHYYENHHNPNKNQHFDDQHHHQHDLNLNHQNHHNLHNQHPIHNHEPNHGHQQNAANPVHLPQHQKGLKIAQSVCTLKADPGFCNLIIGRWYYDYRYHRCLPFLYTGCGGNINNFRSIKDCEKSTEQCHPHWESLLAKLASNPLNPVAHLAPGLILGG